MFGTNFCWFSSRSRFSFLWNEILLRLRSETVRLWDPGFCLKPSISVYVRDRLALGACYLFGTNFCWFGSSSRSSFLWNEILSCSRSETVRLREPVLVIYGPGPFTFEGFCLRRGPGYCLISSLFLGGLLGPFILVISQSWGQRRIRVFRLLLLHFLIVIVLFSVFPGFAVALRAVFALPSPDVKW